MPRFPLLSRAAGLRSAVACALASLLVGSLFTAGVASADTEDAESQSTTHTKGAFGLGLILGEPTGISARLYVADDAALQASVGAAFFGHGIQATADYVVHPWILANHEAFVTPAYVGVGGRMVQYRTEDAAGVKQTDFGLGGRAVAGVVFDFRELPIDAFAEVAGILELRSGDDATVGLALNLGVGARYYF